MRTLVTGANGFAGRHLLDLLGSRGASPVALVRRHDRAGEGLASEIVVADVRDAAAVDAAVGAVAPERLYHLAGASVPAESVATPETTFVTNANGTLNVLESVKRHARRCRVLIVSSGAIYGRGGGNGRFDENAMLGPETPYATSKAAADLLGYQYWRAYGLEVVRVRPFNHTGPGQSPALVWSGFARQIALIEAGRAEPVLRVGNLGVSRDFCDVRDVVRAYVLAIERGAPGKAYNVCSGTPQLVGDLLRLLVAGARCEVRVEVDPARVRADDPPLLAGDPTRIAQATGWTAAIPLQETFTDLLDWWRERVRDGAVAEEETSSCPAP